MSKKMNTHTKSRNVYKQKAEELGIHEATLRYRVSKYGWHIALTANFCRGRKVQLEDKAA